MTRCHHCNTPIRYITDAQHIFIVEAQETTLITERGRKVKGYRLHVCPTKKQLTERVGADTSAPNIQDVFQ